MDFSLSPDQQALKDSVQDFLVKESTSQVVRTTSDSDRGFEVEMWKKVCEMGWPALIVPERYGGLGLGWVELTIIAEQLGRSLLPLPYYSTLAASAALLLAGSEDQRARFLPRLADGSVIGTLALWEGRDQSEEGVRLRAKKVDDGYALEGEKLFVTDAAAADLVVVAARSEDDQIRLVLVDADSPGLSFHDLDVVDRTRRQSAIKFDEVRVAADRLMPGTDVSNTIRDRCELYLAAEQAGIASRCLEMSVEFASSRQQFGKPIGVYQGVSHKLADMYLAAQHAASLVLYAGWATDVAPELSAAAIWKAFVWASQAAEKATADAIQVHGGIGFTWEHDLHMFFKRARADSVLVDDRQTVLDRIASGS